MYIIIITNLSWVHAKKKNKLIIDMKNKGAWKWEYSNKQWFYTILYALTHCYDCFITGSKYEYNFRKYLSPLWNILLLNKKSIQIHLFSYCIKCISKLLLWECDSKIWWATWSGRYYVVVERMKSSFAVLLFHIHFTSYNTEFCSLSKNRKDSESCSQ